MHPTPRLVTGLVGLAVLGTLPAVGPAPWAAAWAAGALALALAVVVDAVLAPTARRLAVRVDVPRSLALGTRGHVRVEVGPTTVPTRFQVVVDLDELFEPAGTAVAGAADGAPARVELPLVARRRGEGRVPAVHLQWAGPLGLVGRRRTERRDDVVGVVTDLAPVRAAAMQFGFRTELVSGVARVRAAGDGSEFEALREHVAGLDPRAIDWKASARHSRLVSREHRAERDRPVVLALDVGRAAGETVEGMPRLDHALRAALLVGYAALKAGDRVGLLGFDDRPRTWLPPVSGPGAFARLLAASAGLTPSPEETNYTRAVAELGTRLRRRSLVVVFTDFADSTTAELLLDALGHLARRHLLLFAALQDPALAALADAPPTTARALHRAVVAADLRRDREVVLRRLRRAGAHVLDEAPSRLSSAALDRYLLIHRRELVG